MKKVALSIDAIRAQLRMFDRAPDVYCIYDSKGVLIDSNRTIEKLTGYKRSHLVGKNLIKLNMLSTHQIPVLTSILAQNACGRPTGPSELNLTQKNGQELTVELRTSPMQAGGQSLTLAVLRDITEYKKVEQQTKSLADLTSENPFPAARITKDGLLVYANATSAPLRLAWRTQIGQTMPEEWRQLIKEVIDSGFRQTVEFEVKGRIFSFVIVPQAGAYVTLYGWDITELKRAEHRLKNAYSKLKETQSQLIQAEKMNVIGTIATGIAHEVKNPLAIILQGIEYLSRHIADKDKNIEYVLENIEKAVKKADNIIKGVLDFGSTPVLDMKPDDLNSLIDKTLDLLIHEFDKNRIIVIKKFDKKIPPVEMNKNRMEQVFLNLFMNAVNAMPDGGKLTVNTYAADVEKSPEDAKKLSQLGLAESSVTVEIDDTGKGIPEENMGKIFDPFFTTRREIGGVGLGLSIVRNIIEMHNAKIEIRNRKEGGVRAAVTFRVLRAMR